MFGALFNTDSGDGLLPGIFSTKPSLNQWWHAMKNTWTKEFHEHEIALRWAPLLKTYFWNTFYYHDNKNTFWIYVVTKWVIFTEMNAWARISPTYKEVSFYWSEPLVIKLKATLWVVLYMMNLVDLINLSTKQEFPNTLGSWITGCEPVTLHPHKNLGWYGRQRWHFEMNFHEWNYDNLADVWMG